MRSRRMEKDTARSNELDRIEKEHLQFHEDVRQGFLLLASEEPSRFCVLDASLPPNDIFQQAQDRLLKELCVS